MATIGMRQPAAPTAQSTPAIALTPSARPMPQLKPLAAQPIGPGMQPKAASTRQVGAQPSLTPMEILLEPELTPARRPPGTKTAAGPATAGSDDRPAAAVALDAADCNGRAAADLDRATLEVP